MRILFTLPILLCLCITVCSQVLQYSALTSEQIRSLDKAKTVVLVPGGILEQHGTYLPSGSDGIFNQRLTKDLAASVVKQTGWQVVVMPELPLGAGAANEIGRKYSFPGSCSVLPTTLRAVYMDWADQLGEQGFRWIFVINGHGDPMHNRMIDEAGNYFHDISRRDGKRLRLRLGGEF